MSATSPETAEFGTPDSLGIAARPAPPPRPAGWSGARIAGYAVVSLWLLFACAIGYYLFEVFSTDFFVQYGGRYLDGLLLTVQLVGLSLLIGFAIAVPITAARLSGHPVLNGAALAYTTFFRGTPLIAQTFLVYYGLGALNTQLETIGLWWLFREAWYCALFTFSLHTAAYQAEILRGAIRTVPDGQREAARALGLGRRTTLQRVIVPQALVTALRPLGNEVILMIKASAIVTVITVYDLMGQTRFIFSRTFDFQAYIWAALLYLLLVELLRRLWGRMDRRLTRHLQDQGRQPFH